VESLDITLPFVQRFLQQSSNMKTTTSLTLLSLGAASVVAQRGALGGGPGGGQSETFFREANRRPNATNSISFAPNPQSEEQWTWR